MTAFGGSAKYYDLLYGDKDTVAECAFVRDIIERHGPEAHSLLDLGCGSARHVAEFAGAGLSVTGVDNSGGMMALAQERLRSLPAVIRDRISLAAGDITSYAPTRLYDAVVSLFHVIDYQTTDEALSGLLHTARRALRPGGVFVFDFWYGLAVEVQRPERREKRFENDVYSLTRVAEPVLDLARHIVEVNYTLAAFDRKNGKTETIREVHAMRYLFLPEIKRFAAEAGFEIVEHGAWLGGGPLNERTWSGYVTARAL
jgi:SAM-dependent methyltransferase